MGRWVVDDPSEEGRVPVSVLMIDLDGVISSEERTFERSLARPLPGAVDAMRRLRAKGHRLVVYSGRSWAELAMTEDWLRRYKVPYDSILLGKPVADMWVDDRAIRFVDWGQALADIEAWDVKGGPATKAG